MKKVDIAKRCEDFVGKIEELQQFLNDIKVKYKVKDAYVFKCYEYAIIALYKEFELYFLNVIVGCINRDSSVVAKNTGVNFGKHTNAEVCKFILTHGEYFDFRGRDGLIKMLSTNIGKKHKITELVKHEEYKESLELLVSLRNYAAHSSEQAKRSALKYTGQQRMATAGSWLMCDDRFEDIAVDLIDLATKIRELSPKQ